MLSRGRLLVALGVLVLFLRTFTSSLLKWSDLRAALADSQFTGALMTAGLFSVVAVTVLLVSALLGRWYCSVLCPFGTLQEVFRRLCARWRKGRYISVWPLRYFIPVLSGIGVVLAIPPLFVAMDPLSNFGRGVRSARLLIAGDVVTPVTWAALGMFAAILALAALRGRRFCDWCPVGTLLGLCSRVAPFGMKMRRDACVGCGNCERTCPMNCVDASDKKLDRDRCVLCLSCAASCAVGALDYGRLGAVDSPVETEGRRLFIRRGAELLALAGGLTGLGGATVRAWNLYYGEKRGDKTSGNEPSPGAEAQTAFMEYILPPGARNVDHFLARCIRCQACAAACPTGIIRTDRIFLPELDYTQGYCQYNCTECLHVCPAHALLPFRDIEEKRRTRIALSSLDRATCVVITRRESCGACAEVCPTHALRMEPLSEGESLTAPVFDAAYCIGCGGCLNVCPAIPKAFAVTGVTPQVTTPGMRPSEAEDEVFQSFPAPATGDDFPF
ncbi:MAG: 4Fe-4S dicluster domain-containing protein [Synergistaceae bacterium]|nr:4Fe-4S dicluster domain-containing protein [Synergistaceae bacterium]